MTHANDIPPRVSIGMPVYNGERYVKAALDAVLAQTFRDFELIISDNASTDATGEICREYAARDLRIRYSRNNENIGCARNSNRTIQLAASKYFKWAHHDDLCAPEFLARCVQVLEQHPAGVLCYPQSRVIDEHGDFVSYPEDGLDLRAPGPVERYRAFHRRFRGGNWWMNPLFGLMRTEAIKKTQLHGSYFAAELVLLAELALMGEFHELPERLLYRRRHPEGSGNLDPWERSAFEDPVNKGRILLPRWKLLFELAKALRISDLSLYDKLRCYPQIGLWFVRFFKGFVKDLLVAAKRIAQLSIQRLRSQARGT
ncbi:MAG: glycosyltransferase family 2 protein [Chromatiales bacterium]